MKHYVKKLLVIFIALLALTICGVALGTSNDGTADVPHIWDIIKTVFISMIPVLELRGAIPIALGVYKLSLPVAFVASYVGNVLLIPFLVLFTHVIFEWIKQKIPALKSFVEKLEVKLKLKGSKALKYEAFGLLLFVAIPLPGTGAWTGSMIAGLLNMRLKSAVPVIAIGVLIAGIIVTVVTYGAGWLIGQV